MDKKLIEEFIRDNLLITFFYFGAVSLILLFFYLELEGNVELVYPFALSLFIYLIYILLRAANYFRFAGLLASLRGGAHDDQNNFAGLSFEQKKAVETVSQLTRQSLGRQHQLQLQNQEKQRVISQIVHNIKTPAAVIELAVQNCKEGAEDALKALEQIQRENRVINDNLDQVLSYLRLDQFEHDYLIERVDLVSQLREKINQKKDSFIYNNVFPKMTIPAESIFVLTDKKWNALILEQIISNAIKYTAVKKEEGSIHFRIYQEREKVMLEVTDNGIGIPAFDLKRIYEPFFTGENGRSVKSSTGIGLYICKKIADELKHQLRITSEVGLGTKVVVTYLTKS